MSLRLLLNLDKDKHGGDICILATSSGSPIASPGSSPHLTRDEIAEVLLYFWDTSSGTPVAYTDAELSGATLTFRSDSLPSTAASSLAWSTDHFGLLLDCGTIYTALAEAIAETGEEEIICEFVVTTAGGEVWPFRVNMIFHERADGSNTGGITVGPTVPTGITFALSPLGDLWVLRDGEPWRNLTEPGNPWEST